MSAIDVAVAKRAGIERLITVLKAQYSTFLDDIKDAGLALPAPGPDAYYQDNLNNDFESRLLVNEPIKCFVWQASSRKLTGKVESQGLVDRAQMTTLEVQFVVLFNLAMSAPITYGGRDLNQMEVMQLRADRYSGALLKCLYRYGRDADAVHDIELVEEQATPIIFGKERYINGVASVRMRIWQKCIFPTKAPLP